VEIKKLEKFFIDNEFRSEDNGYNKPISAKKYLD
jgi:hypothetical protein